MAKDKKTYYRIREVAALLDLPDYTLRYWEDEFPMFNPDRTDKGQRRYTQEQVELARRIRDLLYDKGLKIEAAKRELGVSYRKYPPRRLPKCETTAQAIKLLRSVRVALEDKHAIAKVESVVNFLQCCGNVAQ